MVTHYGRKPKGKKALELIKPVFLHRMNGMLHQHIHHRFLERCRHIRLIHVIGRTRDDAAGEAFDKVARAIGLG